MSSSPKLEPLPKPPAPSPGRAPTSVGAAAFDRTGVNENPAAVGIHQPSNGSRVSADVDADGSPDIFGVDQDGDGSVDSYFYSDASFERSVVGTDLDGDGSPDIFGVDKDGDGSVESYIGSYHVSYRCYAYPSRCITYFGRRLIMHTLDGAK